MSFPELLPTTELEQSRSQNSLKLKQAHNSKELETQAMPEHLWVEPTNACNARCPLCPTGAGESSRSKAMMSLEIFQEIVDQTHMFVSSMNLWNIGEPFLNPDIFDMISYASSYDIATRVSTNGTVFYKQESIKRLINSGLSNLVVSLDGTTAEVFNQYRVGIDFEKVISGVKAMNKLKDQLGVNKPVIVWQFIAMAYNQHQIKEAQLFAEELGTVFSLKTVNLEMTANGLDQAEQFLPDEDNLKRYKHAGKSWMLKKERQNDCYVLWHSLMINADGTITPCCYDYDAGLVLGHFPQHSIKAAWDGQKMQELRQQILQDRSELSPCSHCSVGGQEIIFVE